MLTGWATTAELAGPRLHDALATCGASLRTDRPDIQGQRLIEVVTWLLAVPVATARISGTPLAGPATRERRALDRRRAARRQRPQAARRANRARGGRRHLDAHLEPLIAAVNAATKRPVTALWRAAKDRQDGAIAWIAETTNQRPRAFELLEDKAEVRMLDLGTHEMLLHVREGCCLYYRTPANVKCFSCPLLDDEERRRLSGAA